MDETYPILIGNAVLDALTRAGWLEASAPHPIKRARPDARMTLGETIVAYIAQHPNKTTLELAAAFGQKHRTMLTYLERLHDAGLIEKQIGRPNVWWIQDV